jgi:tetratricopeptide (TPR) repeat protein
VSTPLPEQSTAGAWSGAVAQLRSRLANAEQVLGPEHPETVDCLTYLGELLYDLGLFDQAAPCFRRAYAIQAQVLGVENLFTRGTLGSLVDTLAQLDDLASAEPMLWQELAITEKEDGPGHPDLHPILICLSECLVVRGQVDDAVALLERALAIVRAHEGDGSEDAIATFERIGFIRSEGGGHCEGDRPEEVPC